MKLTAILLLTACLQVAARTEGQTVTLSVKNAPMKEVFREIQKQTGLNILVKESLLEKAGRVTLNVKDMPVGDVLTLCLKNQPLDYIIEGGVIVIKPTADLQSTEISTDPNPPIDIKGRLMNENSEPVIGASVRVKGTNIGTTTNENGEFSLSGINENATLIFSGTNIETFETRLQGRTDLNLTAQIKENVLGEVIINKGYYTEKQKYSVGNVSRITAADIEKQPVQNPLLALQGRVTGMEITQLTGLNGGAVKVRIQGQNSISWGLDPLIVVDGVPYPPDLKNFNGIDNLVQGGSSLNYVNPNDIESISILKDADATSIYGSRAANGAILITTKKGKPGKTKISVDVQKGWGKVTRNINMMNTRQYLDMRYEAFRNDNLLPSSNPNDYPNYAPDLTLWDTTRYTNWQKVLIGGTAKYTNINASISGGTNNVQYLISTTYRRQTTVFPGNFDDEAGGLHFNINSNSVDKRLSVQFSGSYMYDNNHLPGVDLTYQALFLEPNAPKLYKSNGTLNWEPNSSGSSTWNNPLAPIYGQDYYKTAHNLISNLNLNYTILPGLSISSSMGYTNLQGNNYSPKRLDAYRPEYRTILPRVSFFGKQGVNNWIIEPQLKYTHKLGNGNIEGLIGASFQKQNSDFLGIQAQGYVNDQLMKSPAGAPTTSVSGGLRVYKYNAFFGRINYNWKEKYVLNLTGRRDGSSRFGDNNKFHNFGSAGAAWIFTEEKFVERNLPFLSFGKVKASYGTTGNDAIGDYLYLSTYLISNPPVPYQRGSGLGANLIPNPNLQWEETKKMQAGLDLGFMNDRILLGASYSHNQSSNQLIAFKLPSITGFTTIQENFPATIRNTSWEITLHTENFKGKDFNWSTDFNLTIPKNKLVSFPEIEKTSYANGTNGVIVGQPLGVVKVFNYGGLDPSTGYSYPLDRNGNPVYYPNSPSYKLDQTAIVSSSAKYYGGLINTINYKSVQLDFVLQFVRQNAKDDLDYWNGTNVPGSFYSGSSNQPALLANKRHWQKPGDNAEIDRYAVDPFAFTIWATSSATSYTYNASFVRLKNVSVSWKAPAGWAKKLCMQSAALYFRGENLATITKYKSLDPETQSNSTLPPLQIWTIGAKLDF